ncbi:MAG: HD domain-containing protein [Bacteroidota bacterium]
MSNKRKIFNDPVHGFITLPFNLVFDIVEHPYFQRLRRIKQLGLTHMVYPGGLHTRFHHALGAMHLMSEALDVLKSKGNDITEEECHGAILAILLHDIGHGPFSHALENTIVTGVHHETLSEMFMNRLNAEFGGALTIGIAIFKGEYHKRFLHHLVSSQLDMDRLDYLSRDSFYTGVSEGVISAERIIKMLNVVDDELVVEEKGIYSIEKFIVARRLMYWQVYLHKTVVSAEFLLVNILKRAKELARMGEQLFASPSLSRFLYNEYGIHDFQRDESLLEDFSQLDDFDIMGAVKVWQFSTDKVLSNLCSRMINRKLFRIVINKDPFDANELIKLRSNIAADYGVGYDEAGYFIVNELLQNSAYSQKADKIKLLMKDGSLRDIAEASDNLNITALSKPVKKYFLCYPKDQNFNLPA